MIYIQAFIAAILIFVVTGAATLGVVHAVTGLLPWRGFGSSIAKDFEGTLRRLIQRGRGFSPSP